MKRLYCSDVEIEYLKNTSQVTEEDIKMINKKNHFSRKRNLVIVGEILFIFFAVYSLFCLRETLVPSCILCIIALPKFIHCIKHRNIAACYAVVTEKKERWGKVSGRNNPSVKPYEETDSVGSSNRKQHLFYNIRSFYFCTVEINGEIFENICCFDKDYDKIGVGETVVIGGNTGIPVIYKKAESEHYV